MQYICIVMILVIVFLDQSLLVVITLVHLMALTPRMGSEMLGFIYRSQFLSYGALYFIHLSLNACIGALFLAFR